MFWWVELDFFSLECNKVSSSEFWDVSGFGVTLGSLYIEAQGYVPAQTLPENPEEGKLPNSFYEATITLIPKPDKDATNGTVFSPQSILCVCARV